VQLEDKAAKTLILDDGLAEMVQLEEEKEAFMKKCSLRVMLKRILWKFVKM